MIQKNRFLWLLPVTLLGIIFIIEVYTIWNFYNELKQLDSMTSMLLIRIQRKFFIQLLFWFGLIISEVIVYFIIRKKLYNRGWVILHSTLVFAAFVILPGLHSILVRTQTHFIGESNLFSIWTFLFWVFVVAGHIFFILTIVKSFQKPQRVHEPSGLLDEFIS